MRTKINFETSNDNFSRIIGNGIRYEVPPYQRDYSWKDEQWGDLWDDLMQLYETEKAEREEHYMGYLVLQKQDTNLFTIIEGQQRMISISLLILAGLQIFKVSDDEKDQERLKIYEDSYIRKKKGSSLIYQHKLKLNRNNNYYYENHLANLSKEPSKRNRNSSEHLMRKAKEFFEKKIKEKRIFGEQLGNFIEILSDYLLFTVITVGDDGNAYKIFETLNARGVQLSTPDLLKNYLFSTLDPHFQNPNLIQEKDKKWSEILKNLKRNEFSKFLRTLWNSKNLLVPKNQLFKKIKNKINTAEKSLDFLNLLEKKSEVYPALLNFEDELWNDFKEEVKECLYVLKVFNITQPYIILLSAYEKYNQEGFEKICKHLLAFVIRYHAVCHKYPADMDKPYNQMAIAIEKGKEVVEIKNMLSSYYPKDEEFKSNFFDLSISGMKSSPKANYFLAKIETFLNSSNPISFRNDYTIEHILDQKKNRDYWEEQFQDFLDESIPKLANLTLVTERDNQKLKNCNDFEQKKEIYKNNSLEIVKKVTTYGNWDIDTLSSHQSFLVEQAGQIWKINFD